MRAAASLFLALISTAAFAAPVAPGGDVNAMPAGVAAQQTAGSADAQRNAEAAFTEARAECRGQDRKAKRECVAQAQRQIDQERAVKPRQPSAAEKAATR